MILFFNSKLMIWDSPFALTTRLHFLSGPALVAWLGGSHTDSRFRRGMGGTLHPEYEVRRCMKDETEWIYCILSWLHIYYGRVNKIEVTIGYDFGVIRPFYRPWAHFPPAFALTAFSFLRIYCITSIFLLLSAKHQISLSWRWSLASKMVDGKDWEKKSNLWTRPLRLLPVLCGSCVEYDDHIKMDGE